MREVDPVANADPSLSEALRRFEALTLADQMPLLALVLGEELDKIELTPALQQEPVRAAINGKPLRDGGGLHVPAVRQPDPESVPQSEQAPKATLASESIPEATTGSQSAPAPAVVEQSTRNELRELVVTATLQFADESDVVGETSLGRKSTRAALSAFVNTRMLSVVLTMVVSFSVSLTVMLRERKTEALAPPMSEASPPMEARPAVMVSVPPQYLRQRELPVEPVFAAAAVSSVNVVAAIDDSRATAAPIAFNVYNRRKRNKIEGYVLNMSQKPLSVTVQVVGADGHQTSQEDLSLAPAERKDFGTDSGLDIHSNDRLIFHTPPYQDLTTEVP